MLSNSILRNLISSRHVIFTRLFNSSDGPVLYRPKNTGNKLDRELEDALKIEASLFDNSTINHEPVKVSEVLKNAKKSWPKGADSTFKRHKISMPPALNEHKVKQKPKDVLIKDPHLDLEFTRLSLGDRQLSTLMTKVRSRKRRDKDREIVIEGRRLIEEALDCDLILDTLIFSNRDDLEKLTEKLPTALKKHKSQMFLVRRHDLKTWSSLTTPPGLMAIFKRPNDICHNLNKDSILPISVVCDNIREPNNLGSIIRTCASLPCKEIIVTKGCCDPWDSKALRGGCGGQFRVPIKDDIPWNEVYTTIPVELADECHIFIAENNFEKISNLKQISTLNYTDVNQVGTHNIVIIGGESHGVSQDAYDFMSSVAPNRGKCLYIPLSGGMESLNVASALTLILYELKKHVLNLGTTQIQTATNDN